MHMRFIMRVAVIALLVSCTDVAESPHDTTLGSDGCDFVASGGGWHNDFFWQTPARADIYLRATPIETSYRPIDAVIGFSDGRADAFADLGPIVRFNPQGLVDARNGSSYQAVTSFAYSLNTTYIVLIHLDVTTHRYDVFIKIDDPVPEFQQIADDYAFRTEQASVTRLDNIGRKVDSANGSLSICDFNPSVYDTEVTSTPGTGWAGTAFPAQQGRFRAEFEAQSGWTAPDGVIGLSRGMPRYFADLAAIVRFNPAGYLDVRDGSTYRYDVLHMYDPGQGYKFTFDVDVAAKRYSVTAVKFGDVPEEFALATNYAFRTEQQSVTSLDTLGQILDSPEGFVYTAHLMVSY
jgi:hypothetical protein